MKEIEIEVWKSDSARTEIHHYCDNAYLFGFSSELLSEELYQKIFDLVDKELNQK